MGTWRHSPGQSCPHPWPLPPELLDGRASHNYTNPLVFDGKRDIFLVRTFPRQVPVSQLPACEWQGEVNVILGLREEYGALLQSGRGLGLNLQITASLY